MLNAQSLLLSLIGSVAFNLTVDGHFEKRLGCLTCDFAEVVFAESQVQSILRFILCCLEMEFQSVKLSGIHES